MKRLKTLRKSQILVATLVAPLLSSALVAAPFARAAETPLDYPELLVSPRASERIEMEAAREPSRRLTTYLPIQISALSTLVAGIAFDPKPPQDPLREAPSKGAQVVGISVGGGWLVATSLMAAMYMPYRSAQEDLAGLPHRTPRENLIRERMAEEALNHQAWMGCAMRFLSFATNAGASIYMVADSKSATFSKAASVVSIGLSTLPLFFPSSWQSIAREQREYKKKIYAPIANAAIFTEPVTGRAAPGAALSLFF